MKCPDCDIKMEKKEGIITPALQVPSGIQDEIWGTWYKCPNCDYETD